MKILHGNVSETFKTGLNLVLGKVVYMVQSSLRSSFRIEYFNTTNPILEDHLFIVKETQD